MIRMLKHTFDKCVYSEIPICMKCNNTKFKHVLADYKLGTIDAIIPLPAHICTVCNGFYYDHHDIMVEKALINVYKELKNK